MNNANNQNGDISDYGLAFFGSAMNAGAYLVHHPLLNRIVCYMCDMVVSDEVQHGDDKVAVSAPGSGRTNRKGSSSSMRCRSSTRSSTAAVAGYE